MKTEGSSKRGKGLLVGEKLKKCCMWLMGMEERLVLSHTPRIGTESEEALEEEGDLGNWKV